jgi:hypothetical protein
VEELKTVLGRLSASAAAQASAHVSFRTLSTQARIEAQLIRRELIRPVTKLGALVLPPDPTLAGLLESSRPNSYEGVIVVATSLADRLEPHKATLVDAGLREDLFEQLRTAAAGLESTLVAKSEQKRLRTNATAALSKEYRRAKQLVAYIDAMVRPVLEKTPERLAEWESASNFAPKPVAKNDVVAPTTPVATDGNPSPERNVS